MNKKSIALLIPFVVLTGCAQTSGIHNPKTSMLSCATYTLAVTDCAGDKTDPKVTIYTNTMTFDPPIICAEPGKQIKFTLDPPPQDIEGSAAIIPKNYKDAWLAGTNVPNSKKINIKVPSWVSTVTTHDYMFITSTGDCIDPRIEVTN